ncbi:hypothetical protein QFZ37_003379 [Chryseobacterium ginsenosidimutans]|uniref:hypothetical protein n=1 Tax=Chryseobacterium ginsenosidimutans TaxID=687846 RepID=UPI002781F427|nr:hypothetical protein [Chryseobacterium ginsenosidimutans]MDQ0595010.1 hypothetical protein [Chryseobacterium ginsenosidimutans]
MAGRQAARTSRIADSIYSKKQTILPARKQESRNDGKQNSLLSEYPAGLTRYRNDCSTVIQQGSRQSDMNAGSLD